MSRQPLPREFSAGPFRVRDALAGGIGAKRLRGPDLDATFWGIRNDIPSEPTARQLVEMFRLRLPDRAFYFGPTAATIHGLPLPTRMQRIPPLHVGVRAGDRRVDADKIVAHHVSIPARDILVVGGLAVTSPERTWCDLAAAGLRLGELVAAGDRLLWRKDVLATPESIRSTLQRSRGRRGTRNLSAALPLLTDSSDSAPESELRIAFHLAGLPAPRINVRVHDDRGRFLACPDLSWALPRVAVEYEGDHHRVDRVQWHTDLERFGRLQEHGWVVLRASAADYRDPSRLIARLSRILASRTR